MDIADCVLVRLDPDEKSVATFDCGDIDLNNFLLHDAVKYQKARLSVTHILTLSTNDAIQIAGYFSLLTDKLVFDFDDEDEQKKNEKKKAWHKFNKKHDIHYNKHRKIYPAIKIGRLAVASAFAGKGLGRYLIKSIVTMIIDIDKIGCRFITVDAYRNAFDFYLKNDFDFLSNDDIDEDRRLMYVDIKRFYP